MTKSDELRENPEHFGAARGERNFELFNPRHPYSISYLRLDVRAQRQCLLPDQREMPERSL